MITSWLAYKLLVYVIMCIHGVKVSSITYISGHDLTDIDIQSINIYVHIHNI